MSIGIYNPYLDTMSGGEKYILTLASCLAKEHEITLLWSPEQKDEIVAKAKKRFAMDLSQFSFKSDIFIKRQSFIQKLQESRKYDLIIALSDGSIPFLACPLILHFQSPVEWVNGKSLKNRFKISIVRKVICNSQFTKSYIDRTFGIKSTVLYPPVSLPPIAMSTKEQTILHVGRFGIKEGGSSYKKQEVMAKAFKEMVDEGLKDWELVFVMSVREDDMDCVDEFKKDIEGYPIKVMVNPHNDTLWEMYQKASLYWHASGFGEDLVSHPDRAEHFGISTVEAMGMGAVPLTFKAGGQPEIIEDGENGYLWTSVSELKEKSLHLIQDRTHRLGMQKKTIERAKDFSIERFCREVQELVK